MQSNLKKCLLLLCLLTAGVFAQQWEEWRGFNFRYFLKDQFYCPGGSITLPAFDVIPFINSLPLDIKCICLYNFDTSSLYDEYLFRYDPATEILYKFIIDSLDTNFSPMYYYKNGKCAGNWDGSRGWARQHMTYSENAKALLFKSEAHFGGEIFTNWYDTVTYYGNPALPTYDSMRCIYSRGQRGSATKIEAHYFLKYTDDYRLDSIYGTTEELGVLNGISEHRNYYTELLVYTYNNMKQLENVDYSIINTDSNTMYRRKSYQYTYGEFGVSNEKYFMWVDTLNEYKLIKEAVHTYNPQGLVATYSFKNFNYPSVDTTRYFWEYTYDAKKRIATKNSSNGDRLQKWIYYDETATTAPLPVLHNAGMVKLRTANKSIIVSLNITTPAKGSIQLVSPAGKVVHAIAGQQMFSEGSHTIVQPMEKIHVPSGIYLLVVMFGNNKVAMKVAVIQ